MFVAPTTFAVPAVLRRLGRAPAPWDTTPDEPFVNWLGDDIEASKGLDALLDAIGPLIGTITLAGYEVDLVAATPIVGGLSHDHVTVEVASRGYTYIATGLDVAIGRAMPPSELCLALHVIPRRRFRAYVPGQHISEILAMELPGLRASTGGGPPPWNGTGAQDATWDVLHDAATVSPDQDGWWLIGLSAGSDGGLVAMTAAAADASRQLGEVIAIDLDAAWSGTPSIDPLPGLLGIYDCDTWEFPDGPTPFSVRLIASGRVIQGWLGRPAAGQNRSQHPATPLERAEFFARETWRDETADDGGGPANHAVWIDLATATTGTGRISSDSIAARAETVARSSSVGSAPTAKTVRRTLDLTWAQGLMAMHLFEIVDVLGREQIGAIAVPEWIEVDATGFFEQRSSSDPTELELVNDGTGPDDTGVAADTMQVKVAGNRLVGYWQEHPRAKLSPRVHSVYEVEAWRRAGTDTFDGTWSGMDGGEFGVLEIQVSIQGSLVVLDVSDDTGAQWVFVRVSSNPWLVDDEIDRLEADLTPRVRELQRHPLHGFEVLELFQVGEQLRGDIDAYLDGTRTPADVERSFDAAIAPWWVGDQLVQARVLLHEDLRSHDKSTGFWPVTLRTTDYIERLNDMIQVAGSTTPTLSAFFELSPDMFVYTWDLEAPTGGGIGANLFGGGSAYWWATMTVRKWSYVLNAPAHLEWTSRYWASFGGAGVGLTIELTSGMSTSGRSAWVRHDVEPSWFYGPFAIGGAQAGWSYGFLSHVFEAVGAPWFTYRYRGQSWSAGTLVFGPRQGRPDGSNILWTNSSGTSTLNGSYWGAELAGVIGALIPWSIGDQIPSDDPYIERDDLEEVHDIEYAGPANGDRFFDTDVSAVDAETRDWLRDFCLDHLHLLRDRTGSLAVVGHADPRADNTYNDELSLARAQSVYQAFADFLGPHLLVPEERTFIGGRGEWESLGEEHPDTFSGDRRVDLYLAGKRIVSVQPSGGG